MRERRRTRRGFTLLEMLVATVLGILVVTSAVILFIGGVRLALGMQSTSHALRAGSNGIDRLRVELATATSYLLPSDADPWVPWNDQGLGASKNYLTGGKKEDAPLNTAIFLSFPSDRTVQLRTGATTVTNTSLSLRRTVDRGLLLYRGDADGTPNANSGTFLWMRRYTGGSLTSKTVLYRKLSSAVDAVSFRRGNDSGTLLRYRLILAQKDSYSQERTALGQGSATMLEASDYSLSLLNSIGGSVPASALPTTDFQKQ